MTDGVGDAAEKKKRKRLGNSEKKQVREKKKKVGAQVQGGQTHHCQGALSSEWERQPHDGPWRVKGRVKERKKLKGKGKTRQSLSGGD